MMQALYFDISCNTATVTEPLPCLCAGNADVFVQLLRNSGIVQLVEVVQLLHVVVGDDPLRGGRGRGGRLPDPVGAQVSRA